MAIIQWSMRRMVVMIANMLTNKFDCVIIIEGNRGLGKSTLAYHFAKNLSSEMKRRGVVGYKFLPYNDLLYKREEVIRFFNKWKKTGIADEMINVSFNRDFYNEDQKDLIKMMNMNRDHCNLFIACVPHFQTLDTQIKNLAKIRLTVVRRGMAIIQTPTRSIYGRDKWDQTVNERIEREWIKKGISKPKYSRLSTFRGILKFPALTEKQEQLYQKVKDEKRNEIYNEGKHEEKEVETPLEKILKMLLDYKIRNGVMLDGMAFAIEEDPTSLKRKLSVLLKRLGKDNRLKSYFWDEKRTRDEQETKDTLDLIKSIDI